MDCNVGACYQGGLAMPNPEIHAVVDNVFAIKKWSRIPDTCSHARAAEGLDNG